MLQEKFFKILKEYGEFSCLGKKPSKKGTGTCRMVPYHNCHFILSNYKTPTIIKIPPRYPSNEQRRMFRYSSENNKSYFKVYPITKQRKPSK